MQKSTLLEIQPFGDKILLMSLSVFFSSREEAEATEQNILHVKST